MLSVAPKAGADLISGRFSRDILGVFCKKLTKAELINRINIVSDSLLKIRDSKSAKLTAELCIISLCDPRLTEGVDELRARISRIEEDLKHAPVRTAVPAAEDDDDEEEFHSILDAIDSGMFPLSSKNVHNLLRARKIRDLTVPSSSESALPISA